MNRQNHSESENRLTPEEQQEFLKQNRAEWHHVTPHGLFFIYTPKTNFLKSQKSSEITD